MAIEIVVDFPIKNGGSFHSKMFEGSLEEREANFRQYGQIKSRAGKRQREEKE